MKKLSLLAFLILLLAISTIGVVYAGLTSDVGTLATDPPAGGANYTAWLAKSGSPPTQIMTEDAFNAALGPDTGYTNDGWFMQVRNFSYPVALDNDLVVISFGGLGANSGKHWYFSFNWAGGPEDPTSTNHGEVMLSTATGDKCPVIYPAEITLVNNLKYYSVMFFGKPNTQYSVYRSTTASGAGNGLSDGRYRFRATILTDGNGVGIYDDPQGLPLTVNAWYEVIYFDPSSSGLHGCHSEPVQPTSVVLSSFTSSFDLETTSVKLSWETVSDSSILGFNVYRSDEITPDLVKINPEMVLVYEPGAMEGNQYSYTDADVEFGQTYTYWIDVVDLETLTSRYGPVTQTAGFKVFVPILQR